MREDFCKLYLGRLDFSYPENSEIALECGFLRQKTTRDDQQQQQ